MTSGPVRLRGGRGRSLSVRTRTRRAIRGRVAPRSAAAVLVSGAQTRHLAQPETRMPAFANRDAGAARRTSNVLDPSTLPACPTSRSRRSRRRRSTTSPASSSGTRACSPAARCTWFHPDCAEEGREREGTGRSSNVWWPTGSRTRRWSTTATGPSPGRSTDHPRSCRISITARTYVATAERLPDYRVTCIQVERSLRGQGLAAIALRGAVQLIAQAGGGLVEGYPHDTGGVRKKNSSFLYNGTRTMYERENFTYGRPKGQGNCVMVREVAPSTRD